MAKLEQTIIVKTDTSDASAGLENLNKDFKKIDKGAKGTQASILGMTLTTKALGLALKSAGIGIVITALVGLSNAFLGNQKIADLFNVGLEALNLTFKKLVNPMIEVLDFTISQTEMFGLMVGQVKKVGEMIGRLVKFQINPLVRAFKSVQLAWEESFLGSGDTEKIEKLRGELQGLQEDAKDNIKNMVGLVGDYIKDEIKLGELQEENRKRLREAYGKVTVNDILETSKALVNLRNDVKLLDAEQRISQLNAQKKAEEERQIRDDVSKSIDERIEANKRLGKILEDQLAEEMTAVNKRLELARTELATDEKNIDLKIALNEALAEKADLEERITGQTSEQKTNEIALQDERIANMQELSSLGKTELERQINDQEIVAEKQRELARRTIADKIQLEETLAIITEQSNNKIAEINRKAGENQTKMDMAVAKNKRDIVANTLGSLSKLMGEESKAGKALAVGQALINTYSAASAALAPPPIGAGPIFGPIAAAGAIASGLANVKSIMSTDLPGDDNVSTPSTPPQGIGGNLTFNPSLVPNMGAISPPDTEMQPVQAFVIETDISNSQALQEQLDLQATL